MRPTPGAEVPAREVVVVTIAVVERRGEPGVLVEATLAAQAVDVSIAKSIIIIVIKTKKALDLRWWWRLRRFQPSVLHH